MPSEEEPKAPDFVAYPRAETKRKDPDPIPSDRWLARICGVVSTLSFLNSFVSAPASVARIWIFGALGLVILLGACFAAGRGYRVGFAIFIFLGGAQIYGIYLQWSHGILFSMSWLTQLVNLYTAFFSLYCTARFFGARPGRG